MVGERKEAIADEKTEGSGGSGLWARPFQIGCRIRTITTPTHHWRHRRRHQPAIESTSIQYSPPPKPFLLFPDVSVHVFPNPQLPTSQSFGAFTTGSNVCITIQQQISDEQPPIQNNFPICSHHARQHNLFSQCQPSPSFWDATTII